VAKMSVFWLFLGDFRLMTVFVTFLNERAARFAYSVELQ